MIYWYGYLGVGITVVVFFLVFNKLRGTGESRSFDDAIAELNPDYKTLWYRSMEKRVVPVLAGVFAVAVWPLFIANLLWDLTKQPKKENEFAVERKQLGERLTLSEIEARERVADPLGAVPEVPFGHLNDAWQRYCEGLIEGDELWSFTATWHNPRGGKELRSGYVAIRSGAIGPYFLTVLKWAGDP